MRIDGTAADADYSQPTCEHPTSICPSFVGTSPGAIPQQLSTTLSSGAFEYSDLSIFNSTTVTNQVLEVVDFFAENLIRPLKACISDSLEAGWFHESSSKNKRTIAPLQFGADGRPGYLGMGFPSTYTFQPPSRLQQELSKTICSCDTQEATNARVAQPRGSQRQWITQGYFLDHINLCCYLKRIYFYAHLTNISTMCPISRQPLSLLVEGFYSLIHFITCQNSYRIMHTKMPVLFLLNVTVRPRMISSCLHFCLHRGSKLRDNCRITGQGD